MWHITPVSGADLPQDPGVIPARIGSMLHGEKDGGRIGVPTTAPTLSYEEVRRIIRRQLPGAAYRQGLYYRYLLCWRKDGPR